MEAHIYNVDINWSSDRKGVMCSPELIKMQLAALKWPLHLNFPKEFLVYGHGTFIYSSRQQLLDDYLLAIADNSKLEFKSFSCKSQGKLEQIDGKYIMSEILLEPKVSIQNEQDRAKAERILLKSEAACLISNSIKSKLP